MNSTIYKKKTPLLVLLIPTFLFLILFLYYPFMMNLFNSFQKIKGLGVPSKGINEPWYKNYIELFQDPIMRIALKNTLILLISTILFQVGSALVLSLLVDNIKRGGQIYRTIYFFPIVISATALGLLFNLIFLYNGGMLNQILLHMKLIKENIDWKGEKYYLFTMLFPVMWQYVGFYFIIFVTGLNNISTEIYEAAEIDGANGLAKIRYITWPLLHNVACVCLTLAITGALKVFDLPWVMMGEGMPLGKSWLTGTYMNFQTMNMGDVDYASTIAILIVVLGVIFSQIANKIFKEKDF